MKIRDILFPFYLVAAAQAIAVALLLAGHQVSLLFGAGGIACTWVIIGFAYLRLRRQQQGRF